MTHSEFNQILSQVPALSPEQICRLQQALTNELAKKGNTRAPGGARLRRHHRPVRITGKPLSETIIEERR